MNMLGIKNRDQLVFSFQKDSEMFVVPFTLRIFETNSLHRTSRVCRENKPTGFGYTKNSGKNLSLIPHIFLLGAD